MSSDLLHKKCIPCEGGVNPLLEHEYKKYLDQLKGWIVKDGKKIEKDFSFKNFKEAVAFINSIATIAEHEGHHPDILLYRWNNIKITCYTHTINGLHENDFILAAKIDSIK